MLAQRLDDDESESESGEGSSGILDALSPTKLVDTGRLRSCRCKLEHDDVTATSETKPLNC